MQHIPQVTRGDVERVIRRDFSESEFAEVSQVLTAYGTETYHRAADRVHLAILKLAGGDRERLALALKTACLDFRDTIAAAEYPGYASKPPGSDGLSDDEKQRIADLDREQYEAWLNQ